MTERVCPGGHVLDPGAAVCSRCNLPPVGETKEEEVEMPKAKAKKAKKAKMGKAKKATKKLGKVKKSKK